ncbi:hypothetical protein ISCGN_024278 [Ixodes scapularis]
MTLTHPLNISAAKQKKKKRTTRNVLLAFVQPQNINKERNNLPRTRSGDEQPITHYRDNPQNIFAPQTKKEKKKKRKKKKRKKKSVLRGTLPQNPTCLSNDLEDASSPGRNNTLRNFKSKFRGLTHRWRHVTAEFFDVLIGYKLS